MRGGQILDKYSHQNQQSLLMDCMCSVRITVKNDPKAFVLSPGRLEFLSLDRGKAAGADFGWRVWNSGLLNLRSLLDV